MCVCVFVCVCGVCVCGSSLGELCVFVSKLYVSEWCVSKLYVSVCVRVVCE